MKCKPMYYTEMVSQKTLLSPQVSNRAASWPQLCFHSTSRLCWKWLLGALFHVSHFKAKTKTERILVQELLFADDSAIVAHTAEGTQALVDRFESVARSFGLKINIKKTECLYQPSKLVVPPPMPSDIKINNEKLVQSKNFVYLGSTISK